ncbi:hypothetical protein FO519_008909 [Halicephalobus sp. NKZ332]|nr:hypothetical protein FO519_008909 [Halicephalobus sp. NKZ332]
MVLALATIHSRLSTEEADYLSQLDPYCGLFASAVLTIIALPTTFELISFFMVNKPESFRVDDFIIDIEKQFPNIECSHIHVYKQWPPRDSKFDIQMHIKVKADQTEDGWIEKTQTKVEKIIKELKSILIRAGAQKVTIEPRIDDQEQWTICTTTDCQVQNLTCCNQSRGKITEGNETCRNSA